MVSKLSACPLGRALKVELIPCPVALQNAQKVGFFSEYWFRNALLHPNIRSESSRNSTERKTKPKSQDFELGNQYIS